MPYAEVSVNSPIAQRRTFSYSIPAGLNVEVGHAVWVPFGDKLLQGIVMELTAHPAVEETKEISGVIESEPLISPAYVSLARHIGEYYLSPLFEAVALMLPPGFERRAITFFGKPAGFKEEALASLTEEHRSILDYVWQRGHVALSELEKEFGVRRAKSAVSQLTRQGLLSRSYELERAKVRPKIVTYARLSSSALEAVASLDRRAAKQASLLKFLADAGQPVLLSDLKKSTGASAPTIKSLLCKGFIELQEVRVEREPISYEHIAPSSPLSLTFAQEMAFKAIQASLQKGKGEVFLLHGVTGSGKTEVYMQALAEAVKLGKRGIVLVPEIALTPQTIERFVSRFPGKVAILHSALSLGEQFDEWRRIKSGDFDVAIGPRSAVFAPQPSLGLIVIDEEHEWTYKQQDSPRYHARAVAIKLAEITGAVVVMGSATPDVESYYRAQQGEYRLLELPERVTPDEGSPMPQVEVVDLRKELRSGNRSLFSRSLSRATTKAVEAGEQVILFLNRRGSASFIQCRNCGFVVRCKRCEVPLAYHFAEDILVCHQCNRRTRVPEICPECGSRRIKYLGAGTEKLEQEAGFAFPGAKLQRWDSDVTRGKRFSHQQILDRFRSGAANILVGTQMIAKGLDLPGVTLVGVVNADTAMHLPDFRSGERTFQLLSQVAGRAGRGALGGRVVIQTFSPEHYAVRAAAKHDYHAFYEKELAYRRELHNPPLSKLARLVFAHTNDYSCQKEAERMKRQLVQERDAAGIADLEFVGPAPAFVHRLRGRYRWQIIVRGTNPSAFLSKIPFRQGWGVDIDPVGLV